MSEESTPVSPAVEARFKQLAASVPPETWDKLVTAVSDRLLSRLNMSGLITDASPEQLQQARLMIGELLIEYTNVALTCVAEGETKQA